MIDYNLEKLKDIYPEAFTEGKVDSEKLLLLLGENVDNSNEKYSFSWNGKNDCIRLAQVPSTGTLLPCKEDSVDWDTTENLYIEGDNLEVLKLLQKSYLGKVKMVYIDPPYNTGNDFVYEDDFADNIANYKQITGQTTKSNAETAGRYHTNWLNMMLPRLKLARVLLKQDGVIFISIDDNEVTNLRKLCDEVFGEDNFVCQFIWKSKLGKVGTTTTVSSTHEYIVCYAKRIEEATFKFIEEASDGRKENLRQWGQADRREDRPSMFYPIIINDIHVLPIKENGTEGRWRVGQEKAEELQKKGELDLVKKGDRYEIYRKFPAGISSTPEDTLLLDEIGTTAKGAISLKSLGLQNVFDYSKPVELVKFFISLVTKANDTILDFFSGSGTTAHAVMQQNAEDGGNRKFICIQIPELTDEKSEAYKAGYKNICEIGKERIRRAGQKIIEESFDKKEMKKGLKSLYKERYHFVNLQDENWIEKYIDGEITLDTLKNQFQGTQAIVKEIDDFIEELKTLLKTETKNLDTGFKVFKLDNSNLVKWDNSPTEDVNVIADRIQQSLFYLNEGRTNMDFVYEIMLKFGMPLTATVNVEKIGETETYGIINGAHSILICLDMNIKINDIEKMAETKYSTLIFADKCFDDANMLINAEEILKKNNKQMRLF